MATEQAVIEAMADLRGAIPAAGYANAIEAITCSVRERLDKLARKVANTPRDPSTPAIDPSPEARRARGREPSSGASVTAAEVFAGLDSTAGRSAEQVADVCGTVLGTVVDVEAVRRGLRELQGKHRAVCTGRGRGARWVRVVEIAEPLAVASGPAAGYIEPGDNSLEARGI